jgi:UDP-N-acetylglucosamine--N-acetylmuramyl-(pentapeptide) pyrophosphoryl-undecaprenol N-acetylglucosamine transferase
MSSCRVIISGGGTGGHIFPAVAIANAIREKDPGADILFVGARGKMEMEKVPEAGYDIIGLPIRGIQRKLDPKNLKVPFLLLKSLLIANKTIKKFKPDVVVGVGGYASAAVLYTASFMGVKSLIQEQNSFPGVTNKILSKRADRICVAFEGMERFFPKEKIRLLGNPIRQDILKNNGKKKEAIGHFNLDPNKITILAIGGSLGAKTINRCAKALIPSLDKMNAQIVWQSGKSEYLELKKEMDENPHKHVHLNQFIKEMDLAYAGCDLIISRAGAISVSEITALRKACILIPSPYVAEDHQTKNALALSSKNAAILLSDVSAEKAIVEVVEELMAHPKKMENLKENLKSVYSNVHAASDIADEILNMLKA